VHIQVNTSLAKSKEKGFLNGNICKIKCVRPDGRKYDGEWHDGKHQGKGFFILANGKKREAEWSNGKRVRWIVENDVERDTAAEADSCLKNVDSSAPVLQLNH
jgi:hypothetical protein